MNQRGEKALALRQKGYSNKRIGEVLGITSNNVSKIISVYKTELNTGDDYTKSVERFRKAQGEIERKMKDLLPFETEGAKREFRKLNSESANITVQLNNLYILQERFQAKKSREISQIVLGNIK